MMVMEVVIDGHRQRRHDTTQGGIGMDITYTTLNSALGWLLVAATKRGLCAVRFGRSAATLEQTLRREVPAATTRRDDAALQPRSRAQPAYLDGRQMHLDQLLGIQVTTLST